MKLLMWRLAWRDRLLSGAAVLLIVASVLPPVPLTRTVVNHLVVFDITQSMYVTDQQRDGRAVSRLDAAREGLVQALGQLPCGSQIGLGIFSSRRTLLLLAPLEVCSNRTELTQAIRQIDARMAWEDASVIVRGVYSATDVAYELPQHPSVIFMTDGQESPPIETIPDFDRPKGRINGMLVGVGGDVAQPIPRLDRQARQVGWWSAGDVVQRPARAGLGPSHEHLSALQGRYLQALAQVSGLHYGRLDSDSALVRLLTDDRFERSLVVATDVRWLPAALAVFLLAGVFLTVPPQLPRWITRWLARWRLRRNRHTL
ncbi:vWA domain-containing protein [Actimicrobium sp. CCI2.3]|uniref:vWA domain-containing protein n=1 Tax=Actimicrobium sp. CCI2.3 TaxID=3048616 RepID=UPI002AB43087|nr:vWA domain-containing protein [Actimicrobium sp. CCI2.3]MDY7575152.1 vWA domain-containing protein [Actimicrobium sp. CCI2.3]MEB0023595.1 vWA domain-containing protein [Actimicrobium sp. CCI2.3]